MSERVNRVPKIGDVYIVRLDGVGSEQSGLRPCVIFQNNIGNSTSPNVILLPMTSALKHLDLPSHVLVRKDDSDLKCDSVVLCENPVCASKQRLGRYITTLSDSYMSRIAAANLSATSAISFMDLASVVNTWNNAVRANVVA